MPTRCSCSKSYSSKGSGSSYSKSILGFMVNVTDVGSLVVAHQNVVLRMKKNRRARHTKQARQDVHVNRIFGPQGQSDTTSHQGLRITLEQPDGDVMTVGGIAVHNDGTDVSAILHGCAPEQEEAVDSL